MERKQNPSIWNFFFKRHRCLGLREHSPSGICLLLYYLTQIIPHPPFPPLRKHNMGGSWWNPKHEVVTGLSKPSLDFNPDSLLAVWLTSSHAFTTKPVWPTVFQLIGGKSPCSLHPDHKWTGLYSKVTKLKLWRFAWFIVQTKWLHKLNVTITREYFK